MFTIKFCCIKVSAATGIDAMVHAIEAYTSKWVLKFSIKELSFCHKLWVSNFKIVATQCRRPLIFLTLKDIRSNNVSLKYQRFTS